MTKYERRNICDAITCQKAGPDIMDMHKPAKTGADELKPKRMNVWLTRSDFTPNHHYCVTRLFPDVAASILIVECKEFDGDSRGQHVKTASI